MKHDPHIDGVVETRSPGALADLIKPKREVPVKVCFICYAVWPNAQQFCHCCGHMFYERKAKK